MSESFGDGLNRLQSVFGGGASWADPDMPPPHEPKSEGITAAIDPGAKPSADHAPDPKSSDRSLEEDSDASDGPTIAKAVVSMQQKKDQPPKTRAGYRHMMRPGGELHGNLANNVEALRRKQVLTSWNLVKGQVSPVDTEFTPWELIMKYPNDFIGKGNRPRASGLFKTPTVLQNQVWDFFYIRHPTDSGVEPVLLVPKDQFLHLLACVNSYLFIQLTIPVGANGEKFAVDFGVGGTPRPRYLGRSHNLEEFEKLTKAFPEPDKEDDLSSVTPQAATMFRERMDAIHRVWTAKGEAKRKKKEEERVKIRRQWGKSAKRVQRYLGLRGLASEEPVNDNFGPDMDLVCIDVEHYEFDHNLVTEVGVAVLNTADVRGTNPEDDYGNWFAKISAHHYIIDENKWAQNRVHVAGNQRNFNFGVSQIVKKAAMALILAKHLGDQGDDEGSLQFSRTRQVVLVGHDVGGDVEQLKRLKYDCEKVSAIAEVVDTTNVFRFWRQEADPRKLSAVLAVLGIHSRFLHNAGNDAVYTLQALLVLAHKMRTESIERSKVPKPIAEKKSLSDQGYTSGGEMSDGSEPVGLHRYQDPAST